MILLFYFTHLPSLRGAWKSTLPQGSVWALTQPQIRAGDVQIQAELIGTLQPICLGQE